MPAGELGNERDGLRCRRRSSGVSFRWSRRAARTARRCNRENGRHAAGATSLYVRGGESNYNKVAARRHSAERARRDVQFQQHHQREPRASRDRPRRAVGACSAPTRCRASSNWSPHGPGPATPLGGSLAREGGSFSTGRFSGGIRGTAGRSDYSFSAAHFTTTTRSRTTTFEIPRFPPRRVELNAVNDASRRVSYRNSATRVFRDKQRLGRPDSDAFFDRTRPRRRRHR